MNRLSLTISFLEGKFALCPMIIYIFDAFYM